MYMTFAAADLVDVCELFEEEVDTGFGTLGGAVPRVRASTVGSVVLNARSTTATDDNTQLEWLEIRGSYQRPSS